MRGGLVGEFSIVSPELHLAAQPGTHGTPRPELRDDLRSTPCRA